MKKWMINLIMMGLAIGFTACSNDDKEDLCIVGKTVEGCVNGMYVSCRVDNEGATKGVVARLSVVEINGVDYVCNERDQLQPILSCNNNVFSENGNSLIYTRDTIFECVGNEIVNVSDKYQSYCQGNSRVYLDSVAKKYVAQDCTAVGQQCEQMLKGDVVQAVCISSENVYEGCNNTTAYGSCDGNTLVICSNSVQSKGKTLRIDCGSSNPGRYCALVESKSYGYDCVQTCGKYDNANINRPVTDFGFCDNNKLVYCRQGDTSRYYEADCGSGYCGFSGTYYDCIY